MAFRAARSAPTSVAKTAPSRSAASAAKATPPPKQIASKAGADAKAAGLPDTPQTKADIDDAAAAAAKKTPSENRQDLSGENTRTPDQNQASARQDDGTIGKQDKSPDAQKKRDDTDAAQEKGIKDKLKSPAGIALIAALGLTIALVTTMLVKAGDKLKACKDASITVSKIEPTPVSGVGRYIPFFSSVIKPSTIDVSYTCSTSYQPIAGKESWTFSGTGFPELDDQAIAIKKAVKNKVTIECGADDCSDFKGTKGSAKPNCGDFSDYFNEEVQDVAKDTGDFFGNLAEGFADNWSTWLFVILLVIVVGYFVSKAFFSS